ncbi:UPF0280 family protein [Ruegeria pomeroyi]|uniref:ApbE family lipoprotein n=2 Tax=Ruegeria pomeroyi TaxID=89184 RepID=Q5LV74_RUEPO|nr:UPF0280 family protein [Ruegeria pomeroyi]AAV94133.1 hypothetical protein SPO0828 [Ruegeria pomeroyi DSS-3]NVK99327.1 UPF0280 family protein [Ruegeria pomeroyi]NVL03847.1 UPF0280 family protein [Ruegeria pomeroyi]QWV07713.1 UPF0280 family protein [Ruegeria pomeroyi]
MTRAVAALLPDGKRLHLQHGPIDLIIGAEGGPGAREAAFVTATARFETVLAELVGELPLLKTELAPDAPLPLGPVARRMDTACRPLMALRLTRMAAVAGAVADEVLAAMLSSTPLTRAYVNNGGDIALHLTGDTRFTLAMATPDGRDLGRISLGTGDRIGGIATSGLGGRSLSLGIAESVTVLAPSAAGADAAATLIANATDLPGHPAIRRAPANTVKDDSDLGQRPVVTHCGPLDRNEVLHALENGRKLAVEMIANGHIRSAHLSLRGQSCQAGAIPVIAPERRLALA